MKTLSKFALVTLCSLLLANLSLADDMSCGTQLVTQGMTKEEVAEICGEPASVEQNGSIWVYDQGPSQFLKVIIFVNGEVEFVNDRSRENGPD